MLSEKIHIANKNIMTALAHVLRLFHHDLNLRHIQRMKVKVLVITKNTNSINASKNCLIVFIFYLILVNSQQSTVNSQQTTVNGWDG